jgi:ubiquitin-conjugating enzyme E2 Q
MSFASYPVNLDDLKSGQVKFKVGISPNYKPSKAAVAAAFRSHSSNTYTSKLCLSILGALVAKILLR